MSEDRVKAGEDRRTSTSSPSSTERVGPGVVPLKSRAKRLKPAKERREKERICQDLEMQARERWSERARRARRTVRRDLLPSHVEDKALGDAGRVRVVVSAVGPIEGDGRDGGRVGRGRGPQWDLGETRVRESGESKARDPQLSASERKITRG